MEWLKGIYSISREYLLSLIGKYGEDGKWRMVDFDRVRKDTESDFYGNTVV